MNYYNEHDPNAAAWLRALIAEKLIPEGEVDERDIQEIRATELTGYRQCHFFAGIGGWSLALRLAGIPDDIELATGSCPCQPFSDAGQGMGTDDERHLWPDFRNLIGQRRFPIVLGEQVASKLGREWLAGVRSDLEAAAYRFGAADLPASCVRSPNKRQRFFWVAYSLIRGRPTGSHAESGQESGGTFSDQPSEQSGMAESKSQGWAGMESECEAGQRQPSRAGSDCSIDPLGKPNGNGCEPGQSAKPPAGHGGATKSASLEVLGLALGDTEQQGFQGQSGHGDGGNEPGRIGAEPTRSIAEASAVGGVANAECDARRSDEPGRRPEGRTADGWTGEGTGISDGFWDRCRIIQTSDGKARRIPIEPAFFPLVDGFPARVALLKGFGNAINPEVAAVFIRAAFAAMKA